MRVLGANLVTLFVISSLIACGKGSSSATPESSSAQTFNLAPDSIRLKIVDEKKVARIIANGSAKPESGAVDGQVIPYNEAVLKMTEGRTVCVAIPLRYTPKTGDVLTSYEIHVGVNENNKDFHQVAVITRPENSTATFGIGCYKYNSAPTVHEAKAALNGIIDISVVATAANIETGGTLLKSTSTVQFKILDAQKLKETIADRTDNPKFYAIEGQLVSRANAVNAVLAGKTACMTRVKNHELMNGQSFISTSVEAGPQVGAEGLYNANVASLQGSKGLAFVCMKKKSPIGIGDVRGAMKGIVDLNL